MFTFVKNILKMENETVTKLTIEQKIIQYIKSDDRDLKWLSKRTDIPYGTLYGMLVQKTVKFTQERLNLINHALSTSFEFDEVPAEKL